MPTISEAQDVDMSGYRRVDPSHIQTPLLPPPTASQPGPGYPVFMRCPVPPVLLGANPDSLRQFYQGGGIPQFRLLNVPSRAGSASSTNAIDQLLGVSVAGGTSSATIGIGGGSSSVRQAAAEAALTGFIDTAAKSIFGKGSTIGKVASTVIKSQALFPGQNFQTSLNIGQCAQLVSVASSAAVRVRFYGSALEQAADILRDLDSPPPAGTVSNIVSDIALDVSPFLWYYQSRVFSNGETPQKSTLYCTLTNLGQNLTAMTVTLNYLPLTS